MDARSQSVCSQRNQYFPPPSPPTAHLSTWANFTKTLNQTHLSEMNPRRAKQVINTFPSLSCFQLLRNFPLIQCAIFHITGRLFCHVCSYFSQTTNNILRSLVTTPGGSFWLRWKWRCLLNFPSFFWSAQSIYRPFAEVYMEKTTFYATFVTPFRRDSLTLMKESFIFETPSQCCFFADRPLAQDLTHPQEPTTQVLCFGRVFD